MMRSHNETEYRPFALDINFHRKMSLVSGLFKSVWLMPHNQVHEFYDFRHSS